MTVGDAFTVAMMEKNISLRTQMWRVFVKGLVIKLTPPHAQNVWGSRRKRFELRN